MSGRFGVGLSFILLGFALLLHQADVIDLWRALSTWWPLILIAVGVVQLFKRELSASISGALLLIIGFLFLLNQWLDLNVAAYIIPLALMIVGAVILLAKGKQEPPPNEHADLNTFVLFSEANTKCRSQQFQGGTVTTIFGSAEIDLREAVIQDGASIQLTTVFGNIELIVPNNVRVEITGFPIFGGWEDRSKVREEEEHPVTLRLHCVTVFGGAEIKN